MSFVFILTCHCSVPHEATDKLKGFPGIWFILFQLNPSLQMFFGPCVGGQAHVFGTNM